jgi:carbonic anhydrase
MPGGRNERFYGRQTGINPLFLLPSERGYYTYVGSLTEPPCTEGVDWFVLAEPVEVDASYIQSFVQTVGTNARPVQPLNGRGVLAVLRR